MKLRLSAWMSAVVIALAGATPALAADPSVNSVLTWIIYLLAPAGAVVGLFMAKKFYGEVMSHSEGDDEMIRIAQAVRDGAMAYLRQQYKVVAVVFVALVIVLILMALMDLQAFLTFVGVPVAGLLSGVCGWFGMKTATNASARTTAAAKESLNDGLRVAFRAGAVMGLCVTGFALADIALWFVVLNFFIDSLTALTTVTLSFAMGASLQALFARVGGGIYTKAADVGADLVGKVEAGIPEDDARNPATIADNVGDNVGDVAGMGADLYESYYGSILAAMALAAAAAYNLGLDWSASARLVVIPPVLAGLGILCSVASIYLVKTQEGASMKQLLKSLHTGVWASSGMIVIGSAIILLILVSGETFSSVGISPWGIWGAIVAGLLGGLVIAWGTEYYTSYEHKPTQSIAEQSETGAATVIIAGIAEGMKSTWIPLLTIVVAIMLAFTFAGGNSSFLMGVFGVGIAAVGMLATLGITLATDAYGPIADNAGGNAEMTHQEPYVRERTDMLDSLGNTTAATGKGFAIGSAALTALALLAAYVTTIQENLVRQVKNTDVTMVGNIGVTHVGHGLFAIDVKEGDKTVRDAGLLIAQSKKRGTVLTAFKDYSNDVEFEPAVTDDEEIAKLSKEAKEDNQAKLAKMEEGVVPAEVAVSSDKKVSIDIVRVRKATLPQILEYYNVTLMNPRVLCGLFVGVMLVFVFCAMTMNAVGRAAYAMMREARRQFGIMREAFKKQGMSEEDINDPMKWPFRVDYEGKEYPDYANCVAISTTGAQKEMVVPSIMAVIVPIIVGLILGVPGVMGMLAGTLVCGFAVAIFMANAGGAWDNAKKWVETGEFGGKGSDNHKATVVGDTVGDPFKDTSGPSLNILIKLVSVVSVVFCGLVIWASPTISSWLGIG